MPMRLLRRPRHPVRAALRRAREGLLTLAALAGLGCLAAVAASMTVGLSLVVFRSGSMSPAIPEGSVAVVRTVPATSLRIDDVVTVTTSRSPHPVTHRVVRIRPVASDPDTVVLTLRGDANSGVDPFPYRVREVRRVLWSVPGVAPVLDAVQSPITFGVVTVALTVVVVWAFWPHRRVSRCNLYRVLAQQGVTL